MQRAGYGTICGTAACWASSLFANTQLPHTTPTSPAARLVIEADGGQHSAYADMRRDAAIRAAGYEILRFWNNEILSNTGGVLEIIHETLASCVPSPLRGEGQGEGTIQSTRNHE
jgi:hypothetical protein